MMMLEALLNIKLALLNSNANRADLSLVSPCIILKVANS
jgi:hypothetical protein